MALDNPLSRAVSTTAFRLAAGILVVYLVCAALIVGLLFWQTNRILTDQVLTALQTEAEVLSAEARGGNVAALVRAIQARSSAGGPGLYFLSDPSGRKLAGNLNRMPPEIAKGTGGGVFRYTSDVTGRDGKRLGVAVPLNLGMPANLIIGRDIEDQRRFADKMRLTFLFGFAFLALAGLVAGIGVSRLALRRIEAINVTTRSIMEGDLSRRIPITGAGDELDGLAANLNAMLDRIEALMSGLREVSDNIAHDLKTPLNRLRNSAEAALRDPKGGEAYREGLVHTIEKADDLIKTFNGLLLIARLEAGALEENAEQFDLGELVRDVAELYEPVAEERGLLIAIETGEGPRLKSNRQLVGQAVANLVDNAIKYSAEAAKDPKRATDATITVGVQTRPDGIEISVADRGPGIAVADRERVLKRFVRLEKSRTEPGTGLGLSLVQAVARLHGGNVRLEDNDPGLRVVLVLPKRLAEL